MKNIFQLILFFFCTLALAQEENKYVEKIDTVKINTTNQQKTKPEVIYTLVTRSPGEIRQAKTINTIPGVFIKEYGRGMLASISIRGTDASHTQVVWNGVPINSILNGQTDINTIYTNGYQLIQVQKNGNSIQYGSGAIGGVVLFKDWIYFDNGLDIDQQTEAGSFKTIINNSTITYSNKKLFVRIGYQINQSENNYPFIGYNISNENGAYTGKDFSASTVYKINSKNQIYYKSQINHLDREMSRSIYKPENAKLYTDNNRQLVGWKFQKNKISIQTDVAYLYEQYRYYFDKTSNKSSNNSSNTHYFKNIFAYQFDNNKTFKIGNVYRYSIGQGESIGKHNRRQYALYAIWKQQMKKIGYEIKIRKEFISKYHIPFIGGIHIDYQPDKKFNLSLKAGSNYRIPSFNDLYWQPGGNPSLIPEKSYSLEFSPSFISAGKKTIIKLSAFYINSQNLIKWQPVTNNFWRPVNIAQTSSTGIETSFFKTIHLKNIRLNISGSYTYQNTIDLSANKKIPYLPEQTALGRLTISYKRTGITYTSDYTGKIFTTSTNTRYIDPFVIQNLQITHQLNNISISGKINNIFNTFYQYFPSRPQPGRNYSISLTYKIHTPNEKK